MDPTWVEGDHVLVNRRVEDEVRQEMDRDATVITARTKLLEQQKKQGE